MLLKVIPYGNPHLRKQSTPVEVIDDEIRQLVDDMVETMHAAGGVGLSAPQVDVRKTVFVIDWGLLEEGGEVRAYINPCILETGGQVLTNQEGCLSFPEMTTDISRPDKIRVTYQTLDGEDVEEELSDFPARVFQHEYDHLFGILFIDRISSEARQELKSKLQAILDGGIKPFDGTRPVETESKQTVQA